MLLKDLWVISTTGLCVYHYKAPFSDYDIDEQAFSGFVSALTSFTNCLTNKSIDFVKMKEDELHFIILDRIIVTAIMDIKKAEIPVVKQLLHFLGEKFLENYSNKLEELLFDWTQVIEPFTQEIEQFLKDDQIYSELKGEIVNKLINEAAHGQLTPEMLYWNTSHLYLNTSHEDKLKAVMTLQNIVTLLPMMIEDPLTLIKITNVICKLISDLVFFLGEPSFDKQTKVITKANSLPNTFKVRG